MTEEKQPNWKAIDGFRRKFREQESRHAQYAEDSKRGWGEFGFDIAKYLRTPGVSMFVRSIPERIAKQKATGRKIAAVELCGQASGASIGIDRTYAMLLEKDADHVSDDMSVTEGDIFNPRDTSKFLEKIDSEQQGEKRSLDYVFFRPWGGLHDYQDSDAAMIRLYELIRELYLRLKDDGVMLIQKYLLNMINPEVLATAAIKSHSGITDWCSVDGAFVVIKRENGPDQLPPLGSLIASLSNSQQEFIRDHSRL